MRKIFTKVTVFILSLLVFTAVMAGVLLYSFPFQNYVAKKLEQYYSQELQCKIRIGEVKFRLFKFEINQFEIDDQQSDSLLRIRKLTLYPKFSTLLDRTILINKIELDGARINLMKHPGIKGTNIDFIRKYFLKKPKKKSTVKKPPYEFDITNWDLIDCSITWSDKRKKVHPLELDLNYLEFNQLNASIDHLQMIDDSLNCRIKKLSFVEKSGWKVDQLRTEMMMCDHEMNFKNLDLLTPHSHLKRSLKLSYDEYEDLEEPVDSVIFTGEIRESRISMKDLAYFNHIIQGMTHEFILDCDLSGYIYNLKLKNIDLKYGKNSFFKGKARMRGLPEVDETYMDIEVKDAATDYTDLGTLLMTDEIPSQVNNMGKIRFNGNFNGFLNDFVTYGHFNSDLGTFFSDINMKIPATGLPSYSGKLSLTAFDAGKFYNTGAILGLVTMNTNIEGKGFKLNDLQAEIKSDIQSLVFNNYEYKLSKVSGSLVNKIFNGKLTINDPNIGLDFDGEISFRNKLPKFKFIAKLDHAHLRDLHFDSANTIVSTNMDIDVEGSSADLINGKINFRNITIGRDEKSYTFQNILFNSQNDNRHGTLSLKSDIADISIQGTYFLAEIPDAFRSFAYYYLPQYIKDTPKPFNDHFEFSANIKNTKIISELLFPDLKLGPSSLQGKLDNVNHDVSLNIESDLFAWNEFQLKNIHLETSHDFNKDAIQIYNTIGELNLNDSIKLSSVKINAELKTDSINYHLISYEPRQTYNADLYGNVYMGNDTIAMEWNRSFIMVRNKNFTLSPSSRAMVASGRILVPFFELISGEEEITTRGIISKQPDDILHVELNKFNLSFINNFVKTVQGGISGMCSGQMDIFSVLGKPVISASLTSLNTIAGKDTLGNISLSSNYNDEKDQVILNGRGLEGPMKDLLLTGIITLKHETYLNLELILPKMNLHRFEHYAEGLASNLRGYMSGKLKITGTTDKPLVTGRVFFDDAYFSVNYLKTTYRFNQFFDLYENYIDLNRFPVFDENGNTAIVTGKIYHKNYDHYILDIAIEKCKKFLCLKTSKRDNNLFYGEAYASGYASFKGPLDDINIEIKAKSDKGTRIYIPIGTATEVGSSDFIRFTTSKDATVKIMKEDKVDLSGISMNFNFEVTPDAEIQLIFDEALGDIMKGTGNADLKFEIDTRGQFKMYGQYVVEKGEYLFTALNVFQKKFFVKPGGTITWDGDPYGAKMNIAAYYQVKTSPDNLLISQGSQTGSQSTQSPKITVDCKLFLKGSLFSPDIKFGIGFPDLESQSSDNNTFLNAALKQIENDPEELNRQIFALMLMKRFLPQQGITSTTTTTSALSQSSLNASVSDLISAQMSNWLSQVAPGWEVNFNYQPGSTASAQNRQLVLGLLTRFLNDRLILEGSYSFDNQTSASNQYNVSGQYIVSKDGRTRIKVYSRNNQNIYNQNVTTYGAGLYYRREFEYLLPGRRKRMTHK